MMQQPKPKPVVSPVRKEVDRERNRDNSLEEGSQGMTMMAHAFGMGLIGELMEGTNASTVSNGRANENDEINIDPKAKLDPSRSFMPK
jgi:hypothetical protein